MKFTAAYSHHNAQAEWERRELYDWLADVFEAPAVQMGPGSTTPIREHVRTELTHAGWSGEFRIAQGSNITVFSMHADLAFQLQTGNISRCFYDLLKLQYLYSIKKVAAAAYALPIKSAAEAIGSNIASFERLSDELSLFDRIITIPILAIGFE